MATVQLETSVRRAGASAAVIDIRGDVTAASEPALMGAYQEACRTDPRGVVLNFTDLEYMNSGGIGMLVTLLVRANRAHQRLTAFGLSEHYQQIFSLTRIDEAIGVYADEEQAVAAAAADGRRSR